MKYLGFLITNLVITLAIMAVRYGRENHRAIEIQRDGSVKRRYKAKTVVHHFFHHFETYAGIWFGLGALEVFTAFVWIFMLGHRVT